MTRRLELYEWPRDFRTNAEEMYKIARTLLLEARRFREQDRLPGSYWRGRADAARHAAALILAAVRQGRDNDVWYHRKMIRESVQRVFVDEAKAENLGGHMFNLFAIQGVGLDRPEFDEKA